MDLKFYKCIHCANVLIPAVDSGVVPYCCGEPTELMKAGASDGAAEKHVPVIEKEGDGHHVTVKVGEVPHPMTEEHYIAFVVIVHTNRFYVHEFDKAGEAVARFSVKDNSVPVTAYEYCNLHGLFMATL